MHRHFETFMTIKLGTGLKTADDFRKAARETGCIFYREAMEMIENDAFRTATEETTVDLVITTPAELGFRHVARPGAIYALVKDIDLGLDLCSAEVGPQLRLQYRNQPRFDILHIAMKTIDGRSSIPSLIFKIECNAWGDNTLTSYGNGFLEDFGWFCDDKFVFIRR